MMDELIFSPTGWVVLALLGLVFVMVTCVLYTLAARREHAVRVHDLIRQTRVARNEYLQEQARKHVGR